MSEEISVKWETQKIAEVADVIPGTSPKGAHINDRGDGIPFYQGAKEFGTRHPRPERFTTNPVKTAKVGDILLSVRAPVGRVNIADTDCSIGRGVMAVRPKDPADTDYLVAVLSSLGEAWDAHSSDGTMFANLSKAGLEKMEVLWPSTRHHVSQVLRTLDDLIEGTRSILELLDQTAGAAAAVAIELSRNTTEAKLTDVATLINGYSYTSAELVDESDTALVNLKNFGRRGGFRIDGLKPLNATPKLRQFVSPNDVLVAKTDLTQDAEVVGRCVRMPKLPQFTHYVASLDALIVRPKGAVSNEVLFALLSLPDFREHCLGYANGTTVLHLSKEALPAYTLTLPDDAQMENLTSLVAALSAQQDQSLADLYVLTELRSLLTKAFLSGTLSVEVSANDVEEVS